MRRLDKKKMKNCSRKSFPGLMFCVISRFRLLFLLNDNKKQEKHSNSSLLASRRHTASRQKARTNIADKNYCAVLNFVVFRVLFFHEMHFPGGRERERTLQSNLTVKTSDGKSIHTNISQMPRITT